MEQLYSARTRGFTLSTPDTIVLLAAGAGSRLDRPSTPKPLVAVGGKPLITRVLEQAQSAGIGRAVIVVGSQRKEVQRGVLARSWSMEVEFVHAESWELGQGQSLAAAGEYLGDFDAPVLLAMADHIFAPDLFTNFTKVTPGSDAVVALGDRNLDGAHDHESAVGYKVEGDHVVSARRGTDGADAIDAGLFVAGPTLFAAMRDLLEKRPNAELTDVLDSLGAERNVRFFSSEGAWWHDVDTPYDLVRAEMQTRTRRRAESVRSAPSPKERPANYAFDTGGTSTTAVFVERGFVADPSRFQLIPDHANSSPVFVFTDTRVDSLYGDQFVGGLRDMGYDVTRVVLQEGEVAKSLPRYLELVDHVLSKGIDERSVLVSLGGGVVCNVCGFLASTLYRGIGLVHVPTTLMAQCDAAISHKQAMNGRNGKNLVGSYYAPTSIAVDVDVLQTLEDWRISDGLSEVAKHALGQDRKYFDDLLRWDGELTDPEFLEFVVRRNIELKCELIAIDPKEHREGLVLQYGHEVGHAVEYLSGYELSHGESIAIGMMVSARVSHLMGGTGEATIDAHRQVLEKMQLPTTLPRRYSADRVIDTMRFNKKYLVEGTRMALVDEIGSLWMVDGECAIPVDDAIIAQAIEDTYEEA